jgi:hypothetical protein
MTSHLQDFGLSISLDCGLLRASLAAGEDVPAVEILSLAAAAEAIYLSATLESRRMERVKDCHTLWTETAQLFGDLYDSWGGVQSDDPSIIWLRSRLEHYRELAADRLSLFSITEADRLEFAQVKETGQQPAPEPTAQPFSRVEMAAVDRRLARRT